MRSHEGSNSNRNSPSGLNAWVVLPFTDMTRRRLPCEGYDLPECSTYEVYTPSKPSSKMQMSKARNGFEEMIGSFQREKSGHK